MAESMQAVRAWRPPVPGIVEVFHARFDRHAYPLHTHGAWTLVTVRRGDIRFALDGDRHGALRSQVAVLPPHVAHDGRAGPSGAFVKHVLYVDESVLPTSLTGAAVDRPLVDAEDVVRRLAAVHASLAAGEALEAETALSLASESITAALTRRAPQRPAPHILRGDEIAEAARAMLDAAGTSTVTLAEMATATGASTTQVARAFRRTFGIPPHTYLIGRRVDVARGLLLDGVPAAQVAAMAGFSDQAHLTRTFVRSVGTTPGRYGRLG